MIPQAKINRMVDGGNDELYTPSYAVDPILPFIPEGTKTIWCPADTSESNYYKVLSAAGYKVVPTHIDSGFDFLKIPRAPDAVDFIVTNPPFTGAKQKFDWLNHCYELRKPFALLLPLDTLEGEKRGCLFNTYGLGLIVLNKRVEFSSKKGVWFNTSYFTNLFEGLRFANLDKTSEVKLSI